MVMIVTTKRSSMTRMIEPLSMTISPSTLYNLATGGYRYDTNTGRYRSVETGKFVAESTIQNDLDRFNNAVRDELVDITDRMIDGRITLDRWQELIASELKDAWGVNVRVGRGGASQMEQSDYGRYGGRLRYEYDRLTRFAVEIKMGNLTPDQIRYRIGLYANAVRVGYWDGHTASMASAGYIFEERFLNPGESCADCIGYAAQGKVPIGTLPEPGVGSVCQRNCNCGKRYFKE